MSVSTFGPDFAANLHSDLKSLFSFREQDYRNNAIAEFREKLIEPLRYPFSTISRNLSANGERAEKDSEELHKALLESYKLPLNAMSDLAPWLIIQAFYQGTLRAYSVRYKEPLDLHLLPYNESKPVPPLSFELLMGLAHRLYFVKYQLAGEGGCELTEQWLNDLHRLSTDAALRFREDYETLKWGE